MNKLYFALPLLAACTIACEPIEEDAPSMPASKTAEQLKSIVSVQQEGSLNKFTYSTSPATYVLVYDQNGALIHQGSSGSIIGIPPLTALEFRYANADASLVSFKQNVNITDYVDVPEIYSKLFGEDYDKKVWGWDTEGSGVMGNGAYLEGTADYQNRWWIVAPADLQKECDDRGFPNDGLDATMTFSIAGNAVETSSGRKGTMSWDLTSIVKEGWSQGKLTFHDCFPLMGIQFNGGNAPFYEYHILEMTDETLCLCSPEPGAGDWGTAWFWNYRTK